MRLRTLLLLQCIFLCSFAGIAQNDVDKQKEEEKKKGFQFDPKNLVIDGNIGVQLGTYTMIDISPVVAYKFTPKFIAGPGVIYRYFRTSWGEGSYYGWKFISRYYPIPRLFAHAEFEQIYIPDVSNPSQAVNRRIAVNTLPVGIGYVQSAGPTSIYFMILYNLLDSPQSPYTNPIVRVGVTAGF